MKYSFLHIVFKFVAIFIAILCLDACKTRKQEIPPFIDVHLEIKDENNNPSSGATAYLYNSEAAFQAAYQNSLNMVYNADGSILTTTISNGVVDLKGLPSNTEYWILVHDTSDFFVDPQGDTIQGFKVDKDNSEAFYKIDGFQNGTTVLANITLQPVTSLIKFDNIPTGVSNVRLNDSIAIVKDPLKYKKVRKGSIGYQARNTDCVWTGEIDAIGGKAISEPLVACNYRLVTFNAPSNFKVGQEIKIYIGQNIKNQDGTTIKEAVKLTSDNKSQQIVLANDGTTYTYFAESFIGGIRNCVYQGLIQDGVAVNIQLDSCN